ncbi:hypothetical protein Dda_1560 [Drechslerella dactyloides]|uniref:Uncharacterized protein n=1 Tax=Drechslerella dactyloides TaxID=74499 RepID=A0AAD6NLX2_DREDA|nr:hypothetical protein Dda_1560 [Drechslerella dactyloides]
MPHSSPVPLPLPKILTNYQTDPTTHNQPQFKMNTVMTSGNGQGAAAGTGLKLTTTRPSGRPDLDDPAPRKPSKEKAKTNEPQHSAEASAAAGASAENPEPEKYRIDGRTFSLKAGRELLNLSTKQYDTLMRYLNSFFDINVELSMEQAGNLRGKRTIIDRILAGISQFLNELRGDPIEPVVQHLLALPDRELVNWVLYSMAIELRRARMERSRRAKKRAALEKAAREKAALEKAALEEAAREKASEDGEGDPENLPGNELLSHLPMIEVAAPAQPGLAAIAEMSLAYSPEYAQIIEFLRQEDNFKLTKNSALKGEICVSGAAFINAHNDRTTLALTARLKPKNLESTKRMESTAAIVETPADPLLVLLPDLVPTPVPR